jgi:cytochrome c peroxidase
VGHGPADGPLRETRGLDFFRGNCAFCHDGTGFGGRRFEKLGDEVAWPTARSQDAGLFDLTGDDDDRLVFVVPQLRNVARTAPYFHDGSVETLEEAVVLMGRHQLGEELEPDVVSDVVAFLGALDGTPDPALVDDPFAR